jgi:hypothetical protein
MILDTNLENYPTPVFTDSSVTPNPPQAFVPFLAPDGLHTYLAGTPGKYSGGLWHIVRNVLPNTGNLTLSFLLNPDGALAGNAQALEFDRRVTGPAGEIYALDCQLVPNAQGALDWQLWLNNNWADTGLDFPMPPSGSFMPFSFSDTFSTATQTYSYGSLTIGNVTQVAPTQFRKLTALKLAQPWQANALVFQKQLDAKLSGAPYSDTMKDITAGWS